MVAFEIEVDGAKWVTAGFEDWAVLTFSLSALRNSAGDKVGFHLSAGGLSLDCEHGHGEHVRWEPPNVGIGSRFSLRIVDAASVDPPTRRYRCDDEVREDPFTDEEVREMRYETYLELKKEFEPG